MRDSNGGIMPCRQRGSLRSNGGIIPCRQRDSLRSNGGIMPCHYDDRDYLRPRGIKHPNPFVNQGFVADLLRVLKESDAIVGKTSLDMRPENGVTCLVLPVDAMVERLFSGGKFSKGTVSGIYSYFFAQIPELPEVEYASLIVPTLASSVSQEGSDHSLDVVLKKAESPDSRTSLRIPISISTVKDAAREVGADYGERKMFLQQVTYSAEGATVKPLHSYASQRNLERGLVRAILRYSKAA